ncbi:MAG: hypothetical protein CL858_29100 [Cupriavidus sp.]|uniref:ATP-binding protein n=1 Tax=Methylobacterium sp. TaxID=409 RepID=UPI000C474184|nr:ATP-binding protein [Methylobacterium sp.]MBP32437.1 hypothetical protein [Methylobacterium sp.]MBU69439.1 hypothetical protein [Cupriavidus sp.]
MSDTRSKALDSLRASLEPRDLDHLAIMEAVKTRFLTTDRYRRLDVAFKLALTNLLLRRDPSKPLGPGNRQEARIILLVGETGAGKSCAIHRLFEQHPTYAGYADEEAPNPAAISLRIRSPCTFVAVGRQVLAATGYPVAGKMENHAVWQRVFERLQMLGTTVLHFDEVHNVTRTADWDDKADFQNTLKSLVTHTDWPVTVIVSGLSELVPFIEATPEDKRRTVAVAFEPLCLPDDIAMLMALTEDLAALAGLSVSPATETGVIPRLVHAASYQLGTTINLLQEAIGTALSTGTSTLSLTQFAEAYATLTGCRPLANPFRVPDWQAVDCSRLLDKANLPRHQIATPQPSGKRRLK